MITHAFVGLDLTDGTKPRPRLVDRAVMDDALVCRFDHWSFDPSGAEMVPDFAANHDIIVALDGPQGLAAAPGETMRVAERIGGVAGKTPYDFPPMGRPFAGFVTSSVQLFAALWRTGEFRLHGIQEDSRGKITLIEVYPGLAWRRLARAAGMSPMGLKKKTVREGRVQRAHLLNHAGVQLVCDGLPTHDQLDAAMAALTALRFVTGHVEEQGVSPTWDSNRGVLREGYIVYPR